MVIKTTKVADAVLAVLDNLLDDYDEFIYCEPYQNGREHGWSLAYGNKRVAFSEYRNSDEIVVYIGKLEDFSMQGNVPSDEIWKSKNFFHYNQFMEAAGFIANSISPKNES